MHKWYFLCMNLLKKLLSLYVTFFKIGAITFGGFQFLSVNLLTAKTGLQATNFWTTMPLASLRPELLPLMFQLL